MSEKKENLNNLKNTSRNQIIIALVWILFEIGVFIILYVVDAVTLKNQVFTTMIVGFSILLLWIMIRWTMFEKMQLKLKTFTDKKTAEKSNLEAIEMNAEEYRKFRSSKSKNGFYVLVSINIILIIVWATI